MRARYAERVEMWGGEGERKASRQSDCSWRSVLAGPLIIPGLTNRWPLSQTWTTGHPHLQIKSVTEQNYSAHAFLHMEIFEIL